MQKMLCWLVGWCNVRNKHISKVVLIEFRSYSVVIRAPRLFLS